MAQALLNGVYRTFDHKSSQPGLVTEVGPHTFRQRLVDIPSDLPWQAIYKYDWGGFQEFYLAQRIISAQEILDEISTPSSI